MAKQYRLKNKPYEIDIDISSFTYTAVLTFDQFNITNYDAADERNHSGTFDEATWATGQITMPAVISFNQDFVDTKGDVYNQDVRLIPANYKFTNTNTEDHVEIRVIYQGRVTGVHEVSMRTQMISDVLYQSLTALPDGTFPGIGVNFEGVNRDIPMVIYTVKDCVSMYDIEDYISDINLIAGSVNEGLWEPPWTADGVEADEGEYIYLGATSTDPDRTTQTVLITHEFARLQSRAYQHLYEWYNYTQSINATTGEVERHYDDTPSTGKIFKIAGTDKWWDDVTNIPNFSALNLTGALL